MPKACLSTLKPVARFEPTFLFSLAACLAATHFQPAIAVIPEPASALLAAFSFTALLARRRDRQKAARALA